MPMMAITTIISSKVKPERVFFTEFAIRNTPFSITGRPRGAPLKHNI